MKTRYTFNDLSTAAAQWNAILQEVGTNARITLGRAYNCIQVYLSEVKEGTDQNDERKWTCIRQITSGSPRECLDEGRRVYREELDRVRQARDAGAIAELNERLKERTAACLESEAKLNRRVRVLEDTLRGLDRHLRAVLPIIEQADPDELAVTTGEWLSAIQDLELPYRNANA